MFPPWWRNDLTIIARSISSMVIIPTGGSASASARTGGSIDLGEVLDLEPVTRADEHRPLDPLTQLSHVAGPGLRPQPSPRRLAERQRIAPINLRGGVQEARREHRDVVRAFAQRRDVNGHQVDAVQQVFAELTARDHLGERPVRGRTTRTSTSRR